MKNKRIFGAFLILFCTLLWALNGNIGAYLFKTTELTPKSLTAIRLFTSGCTLFIYIVFNKSDGFSFFLDKKGIFFVLLYGFFGLLLMQYSYFTALDLSNAPTATLIQYLGAFLVVFVLSIVYKKLPPWTTFLALGLSFLGVFFLVTSGDLHSLLLSKDVLYYGGLSMIGYAMYNLAPLPISKEYSSLSIVGGGMFFSGLFLLMISYPELRDIQWTLSSILGTGYTIFLGTLLPFVLYMEGQKLVGPENAPIFALLESVFSAIISILWLKVSFSGIQYLGMILILSMNLWLTLKQKEGELP
ncbi:MAG: DMT family transporter [Tissierellia bacterium]|nr:DMT family transporter [Tissierellia bacterium]